MIKYPEITKEGLKNVLSPYKKYIGKVNLGSYKKYFGNLNSYKIYLSKLPFNKLSLDKIPFKSLIHKEEVTEKLKFQDISLNKNKQADFSTIKINSVSKSFGKNNVINNVSLNIPKGKILGLVGVSGSGKTTLLKMIVGFYKPTNGSVLLDNKNILYSKPIRRHFGFGSQENCFYGKLNVEENVRYFAELYGLSDEFVDLRLDSVLNLVGLYSARKTLADNLSTGMKRRLDIACSLIHDPNVVILDEPTEDLDLNLREEILDLIRKINKEGKTVIMTSHLLEEIENICDNVGILVNGKIAKYGSPDQLKKEYTSDYEIHLHTVSGKYKQLLKGLKVKNMKEKENGIVFYAADGEKAINKITSRSRKKRDKILSLKLSKPSLSEVFASYTKDVKK